jgi:hypothetical protein
MALRTPPPRDAHFNNAHTSQRASHAGLEEDPHPPKRQAPTKAERRARAEAIKAQAQKSRPDRYGNVRCISCGKVLGSYEALGGHLVSVHDGENSEERRDVERSTAVAGGERRPPVLLSDGLVPILEGWPGLRLKEGGRGGGGNSLGKEKGSKGGSSLQTGAWGKPDARSEDLKQDEVLGKGGNRDGETKRKAGGRKEVRPQTDPQRLGHGKGGKEKVTMSLLAGHAAVAVSGEGHRTGAESAQGGGREGRMLNPNTAQSTEFVERRGKEREGPKKKRLSKLKKLVLKEREERAVGAAKICGGVSDDKNLEVTAPEGEAVDIDVEGLDVRIGGLTVDSVSDPSVSRERAGVRSEKASKTKLSDNSGRLPKEQGKEAGAQAGMQKEKHEPLTYVGPNVKIR